MHAFVIQSTCRSLDYPFQKGWIAKNTYMKFNSSLSIFRNVEHRIQMINDTQSHQLPKNEERS